MASEPDRLQVAVAGKGGTGKTTIAGTLARVLARAGDRVLAMDADNNPNLGSVLGVQEDGGDTLAENHQEVLERVEQPDGKLRTVLSRPVDEILEAHHLPGPDGVRLVIMGRIGHAGRGCLCRGHAAVRLMVEEVVARREGWAEAVVLDMEAGLEHLSRGTAQHVTRMFAVMEPYYRALETGRRVVELARELEVDRPMVVANKIRTDQDREAVREYCARHGLEIAAEIPYDARLMEAERSGRAPIDFDPDSPAMVAIRELATELRSPAAT